MQPLITVPKIDWIPTEFYLIFPICILILVFVFKIYRQYSANQKEK
ncbi:hypothetical protein IGI_05686 [Bacillus toyonensis]|nr:hypothetical protein IGI_05686 [Bacillus toyonensis]